MNRKKRHAIIGIVIILIGLLLFYAGTYFALDENIKTWAQITAGTTCWVFAVVSIAIGLVLLIES